MEKKKRLKNLFFVAIILVIVAIAYYFLYKNFPQLALKCAFYEVSGFKCPGCGVTHMLVHFIELDFVKGIEHNVFLGATFPFVGYVIAYSCYLYVMDKKGSKVFNVSCIVYVIMLFVWGIVRNIIGI